MTEPRQVYLPDTGAMTKTYSLTPVHIAKVADMADLLAVSQGEVVRQAIDLLWDRLQEAQKDEEELEEN